MFSTGGGSSVDDLLGRFRLGLYLLISFLPVRFAYAVACRLGSLHYKLASDRQSRGFGLLILYMSSRLRVKDADAVRLLRRSFKIDAIEQLEGWLQPRMRRDSLDQF